MLFYCMVYITFFPLVPATILEDPVKDFAFAPDVISVVCKASGFPVPTITWIRTSMNGSVTELSSSSSSNISITEQVDGVTLASSLTIVPTSILDTGNYSCRAVNMFGNVISDQAEVVIYGKRAVRLINTKKEGACDRTVTKLKFYILCNQ